MHVTALVVSWNAADQLAACLASLEAQDHPDLDVLVVDNASSDATPAVLAEAAAGAGRRHPLRVVRNPTNRGFAGAVNDGLAVTDAEAVLLCNVDVELDRALVSRCVAVLEADGTVGSVQPRLLRRVPAADGSPVLDTTGHVLTRARVVRNRGEGEPDRGHDRAGEVFGASGAVVLHRRAMLDDVAWTRADGTREVLTEDLFAYFDDVELDWRARLLGWRAWYEPSAVGVHERGGAGPRRTPTVEALNWANRLLVVATCDDARSLARAAPLVAATTLLKTLELAATVPAALVPALRRLRLLPGALARRRQLHARARVRPDVVVTVWVRPFRWRPWIRTWWRRVRGRAPGVRA